MARHRLLRDTTFVLGLAVVHTPRARHDPVGPAWVLNIDGRRSLALGMLRSDDVRDDAEQRVREALEPDAHVRAFREHDVIDRRCALDEAEHTLADVVRDDAHRHMLAYTAEPTW